MPLPLFPPTSEDIEQVLAKTLLPLNQLLRASTTIPNYLTYKSKIVTLSLDSLVQSLHTLQSENLPPSPTASPQAFLSFATLNSKLQAEIHAKEWETHFLLSPSKFQQSIHSHFTTSQTLLTPPSLFSTQVPNQTPNTPSTNYQISNAYALLLASIIKPTSFRQPNGLGRISRSFTERRFRDSVLAYSSVEDRGSMTLSAVPPRLRARKNWCHVQGGWSGRGVMMVRVVPLQLVSRKVASLFASFKGRDEEFEGMFLEGGNGIALHEPFATAVSHGILALVPTSLDDAGNSEGYKFILANQTYAEKESGRGLWRDFHNTPFLPSPLNTRNSLPSLKFIYFRLLLTFISHLHLKKSTDWFTNLLKEKPEIFQPRRTPFRGEMLRFFLNFAGVDWDTKQRLKGLTDDGRRTQNTEIEGDEELEWKEAEKMARGIKVDCVSFGIENERKKFAEEQRSLEVAVDGLYEIGEGAGTTDIGDGVENQIAGFLIRVVLDDADDEGATRDIVLSDRDEGIDFGTDPRLTGRIPGDNGFLDEGYW